VGLKKETSMALKKKDNRIEFINEFQVEKPEWVDKNDPYGEPFIPEYVYEALRGQKKFDTLRGRQEDSEEFLCFLLDGLHEELKGVVADYQKKDEAANGTNGGGGWLEVGQHNKTNNLRLVNTIYLYR
jgi:ubiquitin carboxyl-terminal hydrolase 10